MLTVLNALRLVMAGVALAAAPALAQDNSQAAAPPPAETVGPRELENFSLDGRVTRPAEQAPSPAPQPVATTPERPRETAQAPRPDPRPSAPAEVQDRPAPTRPAEDLLSRPPTRPQPDQPTAATAPPPAPPRPALVTDAAPQGEGSSLLMWLAALLVAAGAGAVYWFLRSRRDAPALAGGYRAARTASPLDSLEPAPPPAPAARPAPAPAPAPRAATPPPAPAPSGPKPDAPVSSRPVTAAPTKPVGIVASGLRPWIDVELVPDRALVDDKGAAIAFNVTLVNNGTAPARDVSIEARLLNAGARQDSELSDFYQQPKSGNDTIPVIAPLARVPLRTAVRIPRDMIHEYEVEGRKLFMPMVAVSTRYRWSSGEGQTGASFLVGKGQEEAERLAPLRVDQGARSWAGLGARRYEKGLRR
ncbi:hypothetical protein [Sphingomonas mesophila]|uniref:hypothetical protein n=1 Tax=Sphingomonas mesophila TaxID=2303576 RepID=UPI0013C37949|nr:hypothetical protein [Sphingomonas mesophila]